MKSLRKSLRSILLGTLFFTTSPINAQMKMGMNDNWINYYQSNGRFNDILANAGWIGAVPLNSQTIAATEGYTRPGIYTVTATGIGQLYVGGNTTNLLPQGPGVLPTNRIAVFTGNNEKYFFKPEKSVRTIVQVRATDATKPLSNIKITAPNAGVGLYHPEFLAALQPFDTIRFMDPQVTSGSKEVNWADRVTTYGRDLESMIALANTLKRNLWICVPAHSVTANGAPTDYCARLGDLINSQVDPGLTVYLEYSNEVWNWGNPWWDESNYALTQGLMDYETPVSLRHEYARMAHKAFNVISSRIDSVNGPRIKRVIAGQLADPSTIDPSLGWAINRGYKFDCLAGGMYWQMLGDVNAIKAAWTGGDQATALKLVDDGFRKGFDQISSRVKTYATYAQKYGLDLVAYEGGPSTSLWSDSVTNSVMRAYVQSPLCRQQHLDAFNALEAAGTKLFMYYSYCHNDPTWASRLHPADVTNRRYRACVERIVGALPAQFLGVDSVTQGNWVGSYGTLQASIAGGPSQPSITSITPTNSKLFTQAPNTTDIRGLQLPDGSNRVAAWWYSPTEVDLDFAAPADGSLRILSLYFVEWQPWGDSFNVQLVNADSGKVLDTRSVTSFANGIYLRWVIEGHVQVKIIKTNVLNPNSNAKLSGVFLDSVPSP